MLVRAISDEAKAFYLALGLAESPSADAFVLDCWVPMAYSGVVPPQMITVVETPRFLRQAKDVWDEHEREDFVNFIARNPEAGDVRKLRWGRAGSGKRGGARVVYFYHDAGRPLYLLMVYAKAQQEDLTSEEKRAVRKLVGILKG